jgi:hypothetical protein
MTSIGIILLVILFCIIIVLGILSYKRRRVMSPLEARANLLQLSGFICYWIWCFFVILLVPGVVFPQSSSDMVLIIGVIVLCVGVGLQIFTLIIRNRIRNQQK